MKPANVLLTAEGSPKLADFNVSFSCKLDGANPAAFFGGSLAYMSPEQLEAFNPAHAATAGDLDGRADLYSLCVILWELLAGRRPFRDDALAGDWGQMLARMTERRRAGVDPAEIAALPAGPPGRAGTGAARGPRPRPATAGRRPGRPWRASWSCACGRGRATCCIRRAGGWRALVRRFALPAVVLAVVLPQRARRRLQYRL